jgi:tRNA 5-methylaminomethyl-2-thiouridine biosynthesis bifunctional protein
MAEAHLRYVVSSGLAALWECGGATVSVLDVGLGLGLNAIATLSAWHAAKDPGRLTINSLEINPDLVIALASGVAPWQANWPEYKINFCLGLHPDGAGHYCAQITHPNNKASATWQVTIGNAAVAAVPPSPEAVGYSHIWQDPFSPEKNPPLWSPAWFGRMRDCAAPGCVLMTYSVAGPVRRALAAGGWRWQKIPALLATKREWLQATPASTPTPTPIPS